MGCKIPFNRVGLTSLCRQLGITNDRPHDAYYDALAEAAVYRALLHYEIMSGAVAPDTPHTRPA
jgi:DNA polymerase III epsilon subunit-like protein